MRRLLLPLMLVLLAVAGHARAALDPAVLQGFVDDDFGAKLEAIAHLGEIGDDDARRVLDALADESLMVAGDRVLIFDGENVLDALTGEVLADYPDGMDQVMVNNRMRVAIEAANSAMKLFSPDRATRLAAAKVLRERGDASKLPLLQKALSGEKDPDVQSVLRLAAARVQLAADQPIERLKAAEALAESGDPSVINMLRARLAPEVEADDAVRAAIKGSLASIERRLAVAQATGTLFTGLSLGSILLLAALGLAITYGVMGVINMAHGELLMVGAYATYVVQGQFASHWPAMADNYLLAAIPVSFFVAAAVGVLMERTVIRFLYGRPLESLLATWGLSLVLIQAARVIFGPQNVQVDNPSWMSGGVVLLGDVVLPWNRIAIIGFAALVLLLIWLLMQKTRLGMFVRAVTQNRAMAGCVGVPTARVDTMAFALGAGVAGLGGCALSQIANVGPAMGQGYIVDAFMVVVVGGVGQLAGAVWAAMGLGLIAKFLEGWTGAVVAKIAVLVLIIIFIQKRPQGLFALKGRFVES